MVSYKDSGVDINAGDAAVRMMSEHVRSTYTPQVLQGSHGAFAGLFQLDYPRGLLRRNYRNPVLVACTDGVGTKLDIAFRMRRADTVGVDLVAMCVNDLIVQGADPLFFLDYVAVGKLEPAVVADIVKGIACGCREAGCALLGGETAEMPGFYTGGHYDIAGFSVGVAEKTRLILGDATQPGDQIIGLYSSGVHSNGYSLVRDIIVRKDLDLKASPPELEGPLGEVLLEPTRIYVRPIQRLLALYHRKRVVHAIAHITGGGLPGNVSRVLRPGMSAVVWRSQWQPPAIFELLQDEGGVSDDEMFRVFNMGIGMTLVVSRHFCDSILQHLHDLKVPAARIGEIRAGREGVKILQSPRKRREAQRQTRQEKKSRSTRGIRGQNGTRAKR